MRFLVDANMPRSTMGLLAQLDHQAEFVRDTNLSSAPDTQIAARARDTGAVLITRDMDFADIRNYPPTDYPGIIVLRLPDDSVAVTIVSVLDRFLKEENLASHLPGHLVILEADRVRFRPALH
jgi:predicted nuclease of predicted toxin-antitoxin system